MTNGELFPTTKAGDSIKGLPESVDTAYEEVRTCIGAGAYTAGEHMCRKILMNVAVDKGAKTNLNFAQCLSHLENAGYITPPMKPWVDKIRQNGNEAAHEIAAVQQERAEGTLTFTTQMLRIIYEMEHLHTKP